jgi:hypothetical protein
MDDDKNVVATFSDIILPEIENVVATPSSVVQGGFVNITCDVSDNVDVDSVKVDIVGPTGFTPVNTTMIEGSYFYNASYSVVGSYNYFIWASDSSDNSVISSSYMFSIEQGILLVDSEFDDSVDSADLRADDTGQDWYESRNDDPTLLTLNMSDIGGNSGKKAALKNYGIASNVYLDQEFKFSQTGVFNVSFDIFVDKIEESGDDYDRSAYIFLGDDSVGGGVPCSTSDERFVFLTFYDSSPGDTGDDLEIRAREYNAPAQPWAETSTWTSVATDLSYDTWYTIRVEVDFSSGTYDVYIDDVLEGNDINKYENYAGSTTS